MQIVILKRERERKKERVTKQLSDESVYMCVFGLHFQTRQRSERRAFDNEKAAGNKRRRKKMFQTH